MIRTIDDDGVESDLKDPGWKSREKQVQIAVGENLTLTKITFATNFEGAEEREGREDSS